MDKTIRDSVMVAFSKYPDWWYRFRNEHTMEVGRLVEVLARVFFDEDGRVSCVTDGRTRIHLEGTRQEWDRFLFPELFSFPEYQEYEGP